MKISIKQFIDATGGNRALISAVANVVGAGAYTDRDYTLTQANADLIATVLDQRYMDTLNGPEIADPFVTSLAALSIDAPTSNNIKQNLLAQCQEAIPKAKELFRLSGLAMPAPWAVD